MLYQFSQFPTFLLTKLLRKEHLFTKKVLTCANWSLLYYLFQNLLPFYPWLFDHIPLQASKNSFFRHVENEIGNSRKGLQIPETLWEGCRTFQPLIFKSQVSTPDFSILDFFFNPRHFNHEFFNFLRLKSPGLKLGVEKLFIRVWTFQPRTFWLQRVKDKEFIVESLEMFTVQKLMVQNSRFKING